ncbi:hypothetical protein J6U76_08035, partial [bacterium]|nr:hypothetical protein [bacterium]
LLTLLNNNDGMNFAVGDSLIRMENKGKTMSYSGSPSEGTSVKASVKIKTGKFNFKMKVANTVGGSGAVSLDPGMEAWIPRDNN